MRKIILTLSAVLLLAGCAKLRPYQMDIQQGNVLDQKTVSSLQTGMSKNEVRNLVGTPLLRNAFDDDSWNYVYTMQKDGGAIEKKQLYLRFKNDRLISIKQ